MMKRAAFHGGSGQKALRSEPRFVLDLLVQDRGRHVVRSQRSASQAGQAGRRRRAGALLPAHKFAATLPFVKHY